MIHHTIILAVMCKALLFCTAYAIAFPVPNQNGLQQTIPGKVFDTANSNKQTDTTAETTSFDYSATAASKQIPLCMIGDSITWAGDGDCWRSELIKRMPNLAFIGTHTGVVGYSHAGEGGNNTVQILKRIKTIPHCPNYSLLIGTNNNGVRIKSEVEPIALKTATSIIKIVNALLEEKEAEKVFLSSILPCHTDNPLRDQCNRATNRILRTEFAQAFPDDNVVWVEYEQRLRTIDGWEEKIRLHPTPAGYQLIADITAKSIALALNVEQGQSLDKPTNSGVRVVNLMKEDRTTSCPIIAGWYTLSFKVTAVTGEKPEVILEGADSGKQFPFKLRVPIIAGQTVSKNFFTQYERYGYSRDFMKVKVHDCTLSEVLLEKSRPSMKPSVYDKGTFIDAISPTSPGELLEYKK